MISRQNAKPSGGNGQRFVEAVLRREVGYRISRECGGMVRGPGVLPVHVRVKNLQDAPDALCENRILQAHVQLVFGNVLQHGDRIVIQILPAARRQLLKNLLGFLVPGPPQVSGETLQSCQQVRVFTRLN